MNRQVLGPLYPKEGEKVDVDDAAELRGALEQCVEAMRLTREYVGDHTLPAIKGWSWFDATKRAVAALAAPEEGEG